MKIFDLVVISCALVVCISSPVFPMFSSQEAPGEVIQAANQGLQPFLTKIPSASLSGYGFSKEDSLEQASLGVPFKLHTITPAALNSHSPGKPIESIVVETRMWYFPIMLKDEIRAFLIVDMMANRWEAVSLGQAKLAREIDAIGKQWPKSKGYLPHYIIVYQAYAFLFTVPEKGPDNLTSITISPTAASVGGKMGLQTQEAGRERPKYAALDRAADLVEELKPVVEQNLKSGMWK